MPISFDLASCVSMRFPGVQHQVSQYVLTLRQLSKRFDGTQGQIGRDASGGGAVVHVVSDIYYPSLEYGAINLLWQGGYYRMEFGLPAKIGREKAYIATRLVAISPTEAMGRAHGEHQAANRNNQAKPNALTVATAAPRANGLPSDYGNFPSNGLPSDYGNFPSNGMPANYGNVPS